MPIDSDRTSHTGAGRRLRPRTICAALLALAAALALAATALAASPKKHASYRGKTSAPALNGFRAPVSFAVARDGRSLRGFKYSALGCFGGTAAPPPHVNPYVSANSIRTVGALRLARGAYSAKRASSQGTLGFTTITTSKVVVRFPRPKHATGKITYTQRLIAHTATGTFSRTCGPVSVTFTASTR